MRRLRSGPVEMDAPWMLGSSAPERRLAAHQSQDPPVMALTGGNGVGGHPTVQRDTLSSTLLTSGFGVRVPGGAPPQNRSDLRIHSRWFRISTSTVVDACSTVH